MACDKRVVASGRYDPPHCGHIYTLQLLGQKYAEVIVVILDHEEQEYPVEYRCQILRKILACSKGRYTLRCNTTHFGQLRPDEWEQYKAHIYASGNLEVLKHIESLGIPVEYTPRAFEYSATDARIAKQLQKLLK